MADLRFAFRSLARNPGFTVIAVLTLGLGIGFSASTFSFANAFLLRNVPYPEPGQLVRIFRTSRQSASRPHAPANLLDIRDAATSFSHVTIYCGDDFALSEAGKPAEQVGCLQTTAEFFDLLRVQPSLGRTFLPGEDAPDTGNVAVLTHPGWVRRYAGDPDVIGRTVRLHRRDHTIVGVLPESFDAPLVWGELEFIIPRTLEPGFRTQRTSAGMDCVARLKPGVSLRQAQSELDTIAASLAQQYPGENGNDGLRVTALHAADMSGVVRALLWLMTGLALVMLLIACANLASLQVARALGRSREFAVRNSLGGSRRQLMVPLLLESLVLSLGGGMAGLLIASWTNDLFGRLFAMGDKAGIEVVIDGRVFAFAGCSALLSALAFGLVPAWLASRSPAAEALKSGAPSATASRSHQRLKQALIVVELALVIVLVGAATAFGVGARSFLHRDFGWQPDGVFSGDVVLPANRYRDDDETRAFHRALLERLAALPGVEQVALARRLPIHSLEGMARTTRLVVEGQPLPEGGREPTAEVDSVSPDFFAALRIPLRQGSLFAPGLQADAPPVVVINEACAQRLWPGENPVGRRVRFVPGDPWFEVIGVVGDLRMAVRLDEPETRLQLYRPQVQAPTRRTSIVLRSVMPPEALTDTVRQTVAALDADLPLTEAGSLRAGLERRFFNFNLVILNLGISAAHGLFIATIGLFGVISQLTVQRTRDIGVRIALGATARSILRLVVGEGAKMLAVGVALGVPLFYALHAVLHRIMPEMELPGLWLLAADLAVLATAMLFATWLPAHRAARVDPIVALRAD